MDEGLVEVLIDGVGMSPLQWHLTGRFHHKQRPLHFNVHPQSIYTDFSQPTAEV